MLGPFFALAMLAPNRQLAFRRAVALHLLFLTGLAYAVECQPSATPYLGQLLLVAGVVEGATLIGWRLTQLPKSQALEFLLVSPVQPARLFLAEAAVGLSRFALVTLVGLPVLGLLLFTGRLVPVDLPVLLLMPLTWGAIAGIGLTAWAYESVRVRRVGEVVGMGGILLYLVVGVLAGEKLQLWLGWLPESGRWWAMELYGGFHTYNPFAVLQYWLDSLREPAAAGDRVLGLEAVALGVLGLCLGRSAARLKGHFHDRHYRPLADATPADPRGVGERPLAWWAVRRVMEYSGRSNLYLAGGFGILYAAYAVAGDRWPSWLGQIVFQLADAAGGIPAVATGLTVLAAVPAAFQYGLWDASVPDRLRRLELLLLTKLEGQDYWDAAAAAAWRRGRGYFVVAMVLWLAAAVSGRATWLEVLAALAAGVLVWGMSFALGFRAFARGNQANGLGSFLTLGLPLLTFALARAGWPTVAALTPPGSVYFALTGPPGLAWLPGPLAMGGWMVWSARRSRASCADDLRAWYDRNHGRKLLD